MRIVNRSFSIGFVSLWVSLGLILFSSLTGAQEYPEMSIYEIQSNMQEGTDISIHLGDTLTVTGIVTSRSGLFYAGSNGVSYYMQDEDHDEYGGILVYHPEASSTDPVFEGDKVQIVALVDEYEYNDIHMTELRIVPEIPTQFVGFEDPPDPFGLTCADIDTVNGTLVGEPYEGMLAEFTDITYVGANTYDNWRLECNDGSGTIWVMIRSDSLPDADEFTQTEGVQIESIKGLVYHRFDNYFLLPRYETDITFFGSSPLISGVSHSPEMPTPGDQVTILASIIDPNGEIESATLTYTVDGGGRIEEPMTEGTNNQYSATIPAQPGQSVITYYIYAVDNDGEEGYGPSGAPEETFSYTVSLPAEATVADVQQTTDPGDDNTFPSPLVGELVVVDVIAMTDHVSVSNGFYAFDSQANRDGEWLGLYIYDNGDFDPVVGSQVRLTGLVLEYNGITELDMTISNADMEVVNPGSGDIPPPFTVSAQDIAYDDISGASEQYEGLYVRIQDLTITDLSENDFTVTDDSGGEALINRDRLINQDFEPVIDGTITSIQGFLHYAYGSYQIYLGDVQTVGIEDDETLGIPTTYSLDQNYPNPFNPVTTIQYQLPRAGQTTLKIYNITGQLVKTLVDRKEDAGYKSVPWNGLNDGDQPTSSGIYFYQLKADGETATGKMILMK
ncbi:MAG: hypothetical protein B6244_01500 [Candidatus Cloacimonetes bacterium 4572_55]|nr:MAG: hypothetical protein B6244_01500 [Candidatus Cloacimonetes bacterium 4572_55]